MLLSHDLNNLAAFVSLEALSGNEKTPEIRELLTLLADRIEICACRAVRLEGELAAGHFKTPVMIDLSDSKVTLFPRAKRPVPASSSDPVIFTGLDRGVEWPGPGNGGDAA
ncbi:hypothetical protein [Roseibium litorale]|uniref:Uncharacterized protein n=1 Tax=Roseibium litorale TaxID=2803841 RepID=A0ABR9CHE3_9HYPH|nr:hypothetical protein [Roseibium litorale]MBD8890173.1 hypothetical protein [Roseibium litorale]